MCLARVHLHENSRTFIISVEMTGSTTILTLRFPKRMLTQVKLVRTSRLGLVVMIHTSGSKWRCRVNSYRHCRRHVVRENRK